MPGKIWTNNAIRAAVERFITENGRTPNVKELDTVEYLPPHTVVARQYGMTAGQWLEENYPGIKNSLAGRYKEMAPEDLKEIFAAEYMRINPKSEKDYDQRRGKGTPCWRYTAKILGIDRWNALKEQCGLVSAQKRKGERIFLVEGHVLKIESHSK